MTLVVSDVSRHGIVMVGDSAVTTRTGVEAGAVKVQHSNVANIGFALWGDARVGEMDMDRWLADFIRDEIPTMDSVENVGNKLAAKLNAILAVSGRSWEEMTRGIHIAGYRNNLPVLFHIHCGHAHEKPHELRLYRDYPDDKGWSEAEYSRLLSLPDGFAHLRNGYYRHFAPLFDGMFKYSKGLKEELNVDFPYRSLEGRLDFYKTLVPFVAKVLVAAREYPSVNETLSCIAFNQNGLVKNEVLPFPEIPPGAGGFSHY